MAKYSGMSAIQATSMQIGEIYDAQMRELKRKMILHHQKEKTWMMPEDSYERHMFEIWLDEFDTWKYGFGMSLEEYWEFNHNASRDEKIRMIEEYK